MNAEALAGLIATAEAEGIRVISDEIYHGLDYAFAAETAAAVGPRGRDQLVLEIFLHDRLAHRLDGGAGTAGALRERLQDNLAISVPTLSHIAAEAAFDGREEMEMVKHGYEDTAAF